MRGFRKGPFIAVQVLLVVALAMAYAGTSRDLRDQLNEELTGVQPRQMVPIPRQAALVIDPLYNDPDVVSDEELAAVLRQILPRFSPEKLRPNFVEHALRAWGVEAQFADPEVLSGRAMAEVMLDNGAYIRSWGGQARPLLRETSGGVDVRWGMTHDASAHHDHLLASLSEAGVRLGEPVYPAGGGADEPQRDAAAGAARLRRGRA